MDRLSPTRRPAITEINAVLIIINRTLRKKLQWNLNEITRIFIFFKYTWKCRLQNFGHFWVSLCYDNYCMAYLFAIMSGETCRTVSGKTVRNQCNPVGARQHVCPKSDCFQLTNHKIWYYIKVPLTLTVSWFSREMPSAISNDVTVTQNQSSFFDCFYLLPMLCYRDILVCYRWFVTGLFWFVIDDSLSVDLGLLSVRVTSQFWSVTRVISYRSILSLSIGITSLAPGQS